MTRSFRLSLLGVLACGAASSVSCGAVDDAPSAPVAERSEAVTVQAVLDAGGCSTSAVAKLAAQIITVSNCLSPGILTAVPTLTNFKAGPSTVAFMQKPAVDALVAALASKPKSTFVSNSMLRTVAQQFLLRKWFEQGKCGITAAAQVGQSNHESGLAIDTSDYSLWRPALEAQGFKWLGSGDVVHFDYKGGGTKSLSVFEIKGFQMLWNENHPEDKIDEDGAYGPQTAARLAKSPAEGFAKVPACGAPAPKDTDSDGVTDDKDNCLTAKNTNQADLDKDKKGDACDDDDDGDGVLDATDNCPLTANADQADADADKKGDACEQDDDGDGVPDTVDLCPKVADPGQDDADGDKIGDACDPDRDGDEVDDKADNCPGQPNDDQADADKDGVGDACDDDPPVEPEHDGEGEAGAAGVAGAGGGSDNPGGAGGASPGAAGSSTGGSSAGAKSSSNEAGASGSRSTARETLVDPSEDSGGCAVRSPQLPSRHAWVSVALGLGALVRRRRRAR